MCFTVKHISEKGIGQADPNTLVLSHTAGAPGEPAVKGGMRRIAGGANNTTLHAAFGRAAGHDAQAE